MLYDSCFQILYHFYAGLLAKKPCICERPIRLETEMKNATDDTHVYTFDGTSGLYRIFRVTKVDRNLVSVNAIKIEPWHPLYRMPSFGLIGVFKVKGEVTDGEKISKSDIKGKVVFIDNAYAVTIPKIVLDEAV